MPRLLLLPIVALLGFLAAGSGGCTMSQDEREFYGRGWLNPRDLDRPAAPRGVRQVGEASSQGTSTNPWTLPPSLSQ